MPGLTQTRRRFLQRFSLGSSSPLLLPMLHRIALGIEGESAPLRFLFVVEGNSVPPKQIHPPELDWVEREQRVRFTRDSLTGLTLPTALQPLEDFRDRLTILQGLSGRMCSGGHSSDHGALGAYHANQGRRIQAATIDAVLGQAHPGIFDNLILGISSRSDAAIDFNCSAAGPNQGLATIFDPAIAYQRLFGSVAKGEAGAAFTARRQLLDHMREDVQRARRELVGREKEKLDAYLHAFESLGRTSDRLVAASGQIVAVTPEQADKYASPLETDRLDAHFEMATAALIGGLTNCVTIASGVGFPNFNITFGGLGIEAGKHAIGHALYSEDDATAWEWSQKIRAFHFALIARSLRSLQAVPEGDGTMLDRTVVVYLSDGAETHHSRCFEWPFVVVGDAAGKLRRGGYYLRYPDYGTEGHRTINTLYNSLLQVAGIDRHDFGKLDPHLDESMHRGPLSELLV
jgi:hypothetical protein